MIAPTEIQTTPFFKATLPLPPGVNSSYKPGNARHPIVGTEALAQFKRDAALILADFGKSHQDWSLINAIKSSRLKVPLKVEIKFFFKTLWMNDIDGPIKAVQDAVFARMGLNDVLVVDLHVQKLIDSDDPRCEIEVSCLLTR